MQIGIRLEPAQRLQLIVTPELKQVIQILQYSAAELEEFLYEQMNENPLFEVEGQMSDFKWTRKDDSEAPLWDQKAEARLSLVEQLEAQLISFSLSEVQEQLCRYFIGSLDERGYLDIEQEEVMKKFPISQHDWDYCLNVLHSLEPAGVGARSLAECLMIQLQRKNSSPIALEIVQHYLQEAAREAWEWIADALKIDRKQVEFAMDEIRSCDPAPARQLYTELPSYVIPDVSVEKTADGIMITYNDHLMPTIRIDHEYQQLLRTDKEVSQYLRPFLRSARIILKGLEQRRNTMIRVTQAILEHQHDFLTYGISSLKPLTLRQIAEQCNLHESTISRATREKYMQTPYGLFPFRTFFPSGIQRQSGDSISVHRVKQRIQQLIDQEPFDSPLSDQAITDYLKKEGIFISRRTVSKYRQELGIPSSVKRRKKKVLVDSVLKENR